MAESDLLLIMGRRASPLRWSDAAERHRPTHARAEKPGVIRLPGSRGVARLGDVEILDVFEPVRELRIRPVEAL